MRHAGRSPVSRIKLGLLVEWELGECNRYQGWCCMYGVRGTREPVFHVPHHLSDGDTAKGEDLGPVPLELGSVLDDTLADGVEVLNFAVAVFREQLSKPRDVLLLLLIVVVTSRP